MWDAIIVIWGWVLFGLTVACWLWWTHWQREFLGNGKWRGWE